jgi:hypothetical protein
MAVRPNTSLNQHMQSKKVLQIKKNIKPMKNLKMLQGENKTVMKIRQPNYSEIEV